MLLFLFRVVLFCSLSAQFIALPVRAQSFEAESAGPSTRTSPAHPLGDSAKWGIRQIAYEVLEVRDMGTGSTWDWKLVTSTVYAKQGPHLKSKRLFDGALAPEWSHDGHKVAFLLYPYSYWPPASNLHLLLNSLPWQPGALHLQVMNSDGSDKRTIANSSVFAFTWSPTEDKIAFCSDDSLVIVNADGSGRKHLTRPGQVTCSTVNRLSWSPDGKTLAFSSFGPDEKRVVALMGVDGKNAHAIIKGYGAIWSPDGAKLLFLHDSESMPVASSICIVNFDGSDPRKILDEEDARFGLAWFPDGKSIVFGSMRGNKHQSEIFRINIDGTGLEKVASVNDSMLHSPSVSPNGTKLLANSYPGGGFITGYPADYWAVWLFDLTNHSRRRISKGNYGSVLWLDWCANCCVRFFTFPGNVRDQLTTRTKKGHWPQVRSSGGVRYYAGGMEEDGDIHVCNSGRG